MLFLTGDNGKTAKPTAPAACLCMSACRQGRQVTLKWIAERLQIGAWTPLNQSLNDHRKKAEDES